MVNLNSVPERTWVRVIQACDEQWVHRSACGRYLLRRQRVYTPGHDYQIHIRPLLGGGSMGVRNCYLRANEDNCWEITVCDDLRHGRLVTVHTYHPNALNFKSLRTHEPTPDARRELEERFANYVINEIFG
jgi:hypothetical protein